jgi:thiol:disulfide interchange protein
MTGALGRMRTKKRGGHRKTAVLVGLLALLVAAGYLVLLPHGQPAGSSGQAAGVSTGTKLGEIAPDFRIQLTNGSNVRLEAFRGHPVLLWFVATWCSSCQVGAQLLSQQYYTRLRAKGVIILTVELYDNLGQPGPPISQFADQFAGGAKQGWLYGTSGQDTTYIYDPNAYLDIYYAIDSQGRILATGAGLPDSLGGIVSVF